MANDEIKLYSARPFVSHAGPDGEGYRQEVLVTKGVANVTNIDNKGTTAQIEVQVPTLQRPIKGWINTDTEAFKIAEEAYKNGNAPIQFRIEHQRKAKKKDGTPIDPHASIHELMGADENGRNANAQTTAENTRKLMVAIGRPGEELHFSQDLTDPDEDPQYGQGFASSARMNKGGSTTTPGTNTVPAQTGPAAAITSYENAPTIPVNPDGKANPGSYTVQAPIDLYFWFLEQEESGKFPELNDKRRKMLSNILLSSATMIQQDIYGDVEPNREIASFKAILKALEKTSLTLVPLTEEDITNKESVKNWTQRLRNETAAIIRWGLEDASQYLGLDTEK